MFAKPATIRRKLTGAIMLTSVTVLVLTCAVFITYEIVSFRATMTRNLTTRAEMFAANATAAVAFRNELDATELLDSLRTDPHIEGACLYDANGEVFASYPQTMPPEEFPANPPKQGFRFEGSHFVIFQPVVQDSRWLGTLYFKSDLLAMNQRYRFYAILVLAVLGGSTLLALALSNSLQKRILEPILNLAVVARRVSEHKEYSARAEKRSDDEIGFLTEAFNEMLSQIQQSGQEIRQLNEQLEQRVVERTRQLESSNSELEAFSYSVSHDLRAPLRSIDGFSRALLEDGGLLLDERCNKHLTRIRGAAQRMGLLIDDLLNLSRLSRAEMHRVPVDLSSVARQIATELRQSETDRGVTFDIQDGLIVDGDSHLLRVALDNLLRNAWKYTSKHSTARIEIASKKNGGEHVFFVRDDGAGFDMAHASLLFRPFQRLHRQTDFEGIGVGLVTVHRIIERHGGRLWAEGGVEKGAAFYFTLWDRERI